MKSIPWSDYEKQQLKAIYSDLNNDDVAAVIGRTSYAVEHKARKLNLKKSAAFCKSEKSGRFIKVPVHFDEKGPIDTSHAKATADLTPACMDCINSQVHYSQFPCNSCIGMGQTKNSNHFVQRAEPKLDRFSQIISEVPVPKVSLFKRIYNIFKSSAAC